MVSPHLSRKKEESLSLSHSTRKLFQLIYKREEEKEEKPNEDEAKIKVSDLISKMAFYYEKIRKSVDYNEEHLHRKDAIERILKRLIVIEGSIKPTTKCEEMSTQLMQELIRGGYLPNNTVPESKIDEVNEIITKHIKLRNSVWPDFDLGTQVKKLIEKEEREMNDWLIALTASEIESIMERDKVKEMVVSNIYEILTTNVKLPVNLSQYEKDKEIQIYIGIYRDYLKFDREMLSFILFKYYNSEWWQPEDSDIEDIANNIKSLKKAIDNQLDHPISKQLDKIINKYTVYYGVLVDLIAEDPAGLYEKIKNKPQNFTSLAKKAFMKRFIAAKAKLWRSGINSMIYIFLTKSVFVVVLEVPAIKFFKQELNHSSLAINIIFPALLLFVVILLTKISSSANNAKVVEGVEEITFEEKKRKDPFVLKKPIKRNSASSFIFGLLYLCTFFFSFGAIIMVLKQIHFNWVSIIIFLFFLTFVSFFSIRIRTNVRQLVIVDQQDNLFNFLFDFLCMPIVSAGKWLAGKFSRLNVFVFILDFIIETPFKVFIEIAEEWTKYVKERREDIM